MSRLLFRHLGAPTAAHAFDSGHPIAQRTILRRGLVSLLSPLTKANGGYLQAVAGWGGVLRGYTDDLGIDQVFAALKGRAPAVLVALGDRAPVEKHIGGFPMKCAWEVLVYFYSQHSRGELDGRVEIDARAMADLTADPGLDVMMEHVEELLVGQRPGSVGSIAQVSFRGEEEIRTQGDFSLWCQRYQVLGTRAIKEHRNVTQLVTEFFTSVYHSSQPAAPSGAPIVETLTVVTP